MEQTNVKNIEIRRGDIFYAKLNGIGSVQCNVRPVMILSNNLNNKYAPTLQVCPLTSQVKNNLPIHFDLEGFGLNKKSTFLGEQLTIIDKTQLVSDKIGTVDEITLKRAEKAISIQLSMNHIAGVKDSLLSMRMDKQLKKEIINLLKSIRSIEELISSTENDMFIKIALQERESKLIKLKTICDNNGFDYNDFYERYDAKAI